MAYNGLSDGSIEEYLRLFDGVFDFPTFRTHEPFKLLWEKNLFIPDISIIRLNYGSSRSDEHYRVISESEVEGIIADAHSGIEGAHNPKKILGRADCPSWEAYHLKRIR
ncbi:hypothetical protein GOV05_05690 [Candidatus Woesearchaeota archaeon]|nr:hypothetical protein [Candidatus Woesearchaeota archaeon]